MNSAKKWRDVREQLYSKDDDETVFHEISSSQFDSLLTSLNNLCTSREVLKKEMEAISKRLNTSTTINATNTSTHGGGQSRGNYRRRIFGRRRYPFRGKWQISGGLYHNYNSQSSDCPKKSTLSNWYSPSSYIFAQSQYEQPQWNASSFNEI